MGLDQPIEMMAVYSNESCYYNIVLPTLIEAGTKRIIVNLYWNCLFLRFIFEQLKF